IFLLRHRNLLSLPDAPTSRQAPPGLAKGERDLVPPGSAWCAPTKGQHRRPTRLCLVCADQRSAPTSRQALPGLAKGERDFVPPDSA
ncbi:MAG: hypothetical protein RMJ60_01630, partial [Anaerolineales bacterium]|nr:hypothetical protein [Anaerolineales bacterium]